MGSIIRKLFSIRDQLILVFMLELLHFSIWSDLSGPVSQSLLLMHLGLFLLWQPLLRGEERLRWYDIGLLFLLTYTFLFWIDWWLIFAWTLLLMGLAGGRVIINRRERAVYMFGLIFLVFEILIRITPMLFAVSLSPNISDIFKVVLPVMPLAIIAMPLKQEDRRFLSVDFIHAITISTLTGLLVVGTLLNMYRTESDYITALVQTSIVIGVFLMAISWLSIPRKRFSGLPQLWMKSMLNIGTPFEGFLNSLSILFRRQSSPEEFLSATMDELIELPWIEGVEWTINDSVQLTGNHARIRTEFTIDTLKVTVFSYTPVSGALYLHCKLLMQLINNFYIAKVRERELTRQTHLQAVYETGARITHDIKNLLQSLQAITSIISTESELENYSVSGRILKRQLPTLTERLKLALEKLQTPDSREHETVYLKDWWEDLKSRTTLKNITFNEDISGDQVIPVELFDSVMDNLLDNIRNKTQLNENLATNISLFSNERNIILRISDNGERIPDDKARFLLKEPLQSENGLGIGLYQAARHADSLGYQFFLKHNLDGNVCFELSREKPSGQIDLI